MEGPGDVKRDATAYRDYDISVATERMNDGAWAVVARAVHRTPTAEDIFPVPVPDRRFPTEQEAREFGTRVARDWIDANAPRG
jgi:hypothetical protein